MFQFLRGFPSAATALPVRPPAADTIVSIPSRLSIRCNSAAPRGCCQAEPFQFLRGFPSAATSAWVWTAGNDGDVSIPSRLSIRCNVDGRRHGRVAGHGFNSFAAFHPLQHVLLAYIESALAAVSIPSRLSIRCNPLAGTDIPEWFSVSIPSRLSIRCNRTVYRDSDRRRSFNSFAAFHPLQPSYDG